MTDDAIVIGCRETAAVTASGFVDARGPTALTLRDGDLEIAIEGDVGATQGQPSVASTDARSGRLFAVPSRPVVDAVPVREAEFDDAGAEPGDAPTRLRRLEDVLGETGLGATRPPKAPNAPPRRPAEVAAAASVTAPRRRLSTGARRFALLGMLACALMLLLRARRARDASDRALRTPAAGALAPARATDSADPGAADAIAPTPPPRTTVAARGPAHKGTLTQARRAADALASGDYAGALDLYEGLASEESNPAYARIVDSLRSRPPTSP
jgi:hypothetical protein